LQPVVFSLFHYDFSFAYVEIAAACLLSYWLIVYEKSSISVHEYYRVKLATAFYHEDTREMALKELPDRPKLLVNTTLNNFVSLSDGRSAHHFLLSKNRCGSHYTGFIGSEKHPQDPKIKPPIETERDYKDMMLSTAMALSGAAVANRFGAAADNYPALIRSAITLSVSFFNFGMAAWAPRPDGGYLKRFSFSGKF
jgi:hypothetical protein